MKLMIHTSSDLLLCIGKEKGGKGGIMKPGGNGGGMKGNCPGIVCPGVPAAVAAAGGGF